MPIRLIVLLLALAGAPGPAAVAAPTPAEAVERAENELWGKTLNGEVEMTVTTPTWSRSLSLTIWMDRPNRSFLRVTAPAKEAGIASLRIGSEMWNYLPSIERTIKIPPSLMLQPWLGSDFSNDDLVKESSLVQDYDHRFLPDEAIDGQTAYRIECLPKPGRPVVWGKILYAVRKADFVPLKLSYYDERGALVRELTYSGIRKIEGRHVPTRWEMVPAATPGKKTVITIRRMQYDRALDPEIFSLRSLKQKG